MLISGSIYLHIGVIQSARNNNAHTEIVALDHDSGETNRACVNYV